MPHLDFKVAYNLNLDASELRLVTLGLEGRLEKAEDVQAAKALAQKLLEQRAARANSWVNALKDPSP